jgi:beta-1,4-mannosyl-glycoprotein beta-1,4-N-acetylglucosaminyltransferase
MARVFDVFTFYNELDLLELRLEMLDPYVDQFVLVECVETFSGKQKPLYFQDNKERFSKYLHKIHHHVTYDPPKSFEDLQQRIVTARPNTDKGIKDLWIQALTTSNVPKGEVHWLKEFYQKEMIRFAIENAGAESEDLIFVTDLDEYWNPELDYTNIEDHKIYKLRQLAYSGYMNVRSSEAWAGTLLTKYKNIDGACLNHLRTHSKTAYEYIDNGGWHFTFMGGEQQVKMKLEAYGHQEYNNDGIKNNVKLLLEQGKDVLGRNEFKFWIDESQLPKYLIDNKDKYKQYFK